MGISGPETFVRTSFLKMEFRPRWTETDTMTIGPRALAVKGSVDKETNTVLQTQIAPTENAVSELEVQVTCRTENTENENRKNWKN